MSDFSGQQLPQQPQAPFQNPPPEPSTGAPVAITRTLMGVGVAIICVGCLGALLLLGVSFARETARRIQCSHNLRLQGLTVHIFHDSYNAMPPLAIGDGNASLFVMMMPFGEKQKIYNLYIGGNATQSTNVDSVMDGTDAGNWSKLSSSEREAAASIKWLHCPSRRAGIQQTAAIAGSQYAGSSGDYAVVFIDQDPQGKQFPPPDVSAQSGWQLHQNPCDRTEVDRQKGVIRLAYLECQDGTPPNVALWKPRDTFDRIVDGLANTFMVGEKHVRRGELNKYSAKQEEQDGVYLFTSNSGGRNYNVARNIGLPITARSRDFTAPGEGPHKDFGFGSWHSGVVQFLRAEGSVSACAAKMDPQVLCLLGHAQDGMEIDPEFD